MDIPEFIYDIIIEEQEGTLNAENKAVLSKWLNESSKNHEAYLEVKSIWDAGLVLKLQDKDYQNTVWDKIKSQAPSRTRSIKRWIQISVAASVALLAGVYAVLYYSKIENEAQWAKVSELAKAEVPVKLVLSSGEEIILSDSIEKYLDVEGSNIQSKKGVISYQNKKENNKDFIAYHELIVSKRGRHDIQLADGTVVNINSESKLKYPNQFNDSIREVWLTGEAYFSVAHNPQKPFIVHSNGFDTRVLGTEFNVNTYNDEKQNTVTLVNGSVKLISKADSKMLKPGYQFSIKKGEDFKSSEINKIDVALYTAWKDGILFFDNITLEQLMIRISRWYNFEYQFDDDLLKEKLYTGGIKKKDDLTKIFRIIEKVNDVKFSLNDDLIIISNK